MPRRTFGQKVKRTAKKIMARHEGKLDKGAAKARARHQVKNRWLKTASPKQLKKAVGRQKSKYGKLYGKGDTA